MRGYLHTERYFKTKNDFVEITNPNQYKETFSSGDTNYGLFTMVCGLWASIYGAYFRRNGR
ncbi:MAG: hypothetical protein ACP5KG_10635 [Myxococcota bacterium]